jgi:hypothetical protein
LPHLSRKALNILLKGVPSPQQETSEYSPGEEFPHLSKKALNILLEGSSLTSARKL